MRIHIFVMATPTSTCSVCLARAAANAADETQGEGGDDGNLSDNGAIVNISRAVVAVGVCVYWIVYWNIGK